MKSNSIHYEVLGQRGTAWTIIAVVDEQHEAMKKAQEARTSYRAVKVMRERFDKDSNTYRSGQIFYAGAQAKPSKIDPDEVADVCWKVDDFYSYEGRRSINRLLRKELMEWGITATELIHSHEHIQRLQDNGTSIQRAVQQTAIVQIRETGQGVQERIKQIYELIEKGARVLEKDMPSFPSIVGDRLDEVIEQVESRESRSYLLHGALTRYLGGAKGFNDKMVLVLGLIRADHPDWVHEVADNFVAELLSIGKVLSVLIGDRKTLKDEMIAAAKLAIGRADPADDNYPTEARMVNRLIAAGKMPATHQALTRFVIEALKGKRLLIEGGILDEAKALSEVAENLKSEKDEWIGSLSMVEAIGRRCGRWLHPEAVAELLKDATEPDAKLKRLLSLEANVFGNANKRKIGDFLVPIIASPQGEMYLTLEGGTVTAKLRRLRAMQDMVLQSSLLDMHRSKLALKLDELAYRVVRNSKLIERISSSKDGIVDRCFALLKMIVDGYFTMGNTETAARNAVKRCLSSPEFTAGFLRAGLSREEKMSRLEALSKLLKQAGVDIQDTLGAPPPKPDADVTASA
ncbi:MAG: hypothetical protein ACMVY4_16345 [Minwuia sp.]|uniref:hypothetical protein n=1 Tax=Minwuia sp. TaxID=2493630 RepID=UPI003A850CF6